MKKDLSSWGRTTRAARRHSFSFCLKLRTSIWRWTTQEIGKKVKQNLVCKTFHSPCTLFMVRTYHNLANLVRENGNSLHLRVSCDIPGMWMHATTTESLINARTFTNGYETTGGDRYHRRLMAWGAPYRWSTNGEKCFRRRINIWSSGEHSVSLVSTSYVVQAVEHFSTASYLTTVRCTKKPAEIRRFTTGFKMEGRTTVRSGGETS